MIRTVLSLAVSHSWPVHQLDVKNAFLHDTLFGDCLLQPMFFGVACKPENIF
jgi:hypothetical protein